MSTMKSILRASTVAAAGMAFSACASQAGADRYGNVYDYESGGQCAATQSCGAGTVTSSRYGDTGYVAPAAPVYAPRTDNVIYADCSVMNNMNCGHTQHVQQVQTYQPAPAPVYQAPVQTQSYNSGIAYGGETAPCPAGTTAAGDGTCMQSSSSYGSTTTQSYGSVSMPGTGTYSGETAPCPAGTTAAGDGTCMESSYGNSTQSYGGVSMPGTGTYSGTTSTYGGSSYSSSSYGGEMAACPSGTSKQSDGSCAMNEGMSTGSIEIYNEPATTTSGSYGGYTSTGGYTANDYMPVRK